jgi:hypothetical protein
MQGGDDSMVLSATNHTIAAAEAGMSLFRYYIITLVLAEFLVRN